MTDVSHEIYAWKALSYYRDEDGIKTYLEYNRRAIPFWVVLPEEISEWLRVTVHCTVAATKQIPQQRVSEPRSTGLRCSNHGAKNSSVDIPAQAGAQALRLRPPHWISQDCLHC